MRSTFIVGFLLCPNLFAQTFEAETTNDTNIERIEVIGEKSRLSDRLGVSTFVIDRAEIERKNFPSISQYLQQIPGLFIRQTGAAGGQISVNIRGSGSGNVLIMLDGIPLADPSSISGNFDLTHISVADVEAIEVYKGAHAVAYGANALGGIINIVSSKDGAGRRVYAGVGSGEFLRIGGQYARQSEDKAWTTRLNIESLGYDYGSETAQELGDEESDPYQRLFGSFFGRYAGEGWYTALQYRASHTQKDLDGFGSDSSFQDDLNYEADEQSRVYQINSGLKLGNVDFMLELSRTTNDREYRDQVDGEGDVDDTSDFDSVLDLATLTASTPIGETQSLTVGIETRLESIDAPGLEESDRAQSVFLSYSLEVKSDLSLTLGARRDDFDRSGVEETGSVQLDYNLDYGTIYALANKGFKAPTLFQSFDPNFGNPDLEAEEGYSYELGYKLDRGIAFVDVAVFQNEFENRVAFRNVEPNYYNIAGLVTTRGAEIIIGHIWTSHRLELSASYLDLTKNSVEFAVPRNQYDIEYIWMNGPLQLGAQADWVGPRRDAFTDLEEYTDVDAFVSYQRAGYKVYGQAENIFDRSYPIVQGYQDAQRQFVVGGEWRF